MGGILPPTIIFPNLSNSSQLLPEEVNENISLIHESPTEKNKSQIGPPNKIEIKEDFYIDDFVITKIMTKQVDFFYGTLTDSHCNYIASIEIPASQTGTLSVNDLAKKIAAQNKTNRIAIPSKNYFNDQIAKKEAISIRTYKCMDFIEGDELNQQLNNSRASDSISIFAGQYIKRYGYLEALGEKVPTLGFEYNSFFLNFSDSRYQKSKWGAYILWSFDHYLLTDSKLLAQPFKGKDFTSYFFSVGGIYRHEFNEIFYAQYNLGAGMHTNEIDTFGKDSSKDSIYTDTAYSMVHKFGLFYGPRPRRKNWVAYSSKDIQLQYGISAIYYYAPNLLGKFANENINTPRDPGGSWSLVLELKWEKL